VAAVAKLTMSDAEMAEIDRHVVAPGTDIWSAG
jgi:hypothetical protein